MTYPAYVLAIDADRLPLVYWQVLQLFSQPVLSAYGSCADIGVSIAHSRRERRHDGSLEIKGPPLAPETCIATSFDAIQRVSALENIHTACKPLPNSRSGRLRMVLLFPSSLRDGGCP